MNNVVNNKRVFYVAPHRPIGFVEMLGKRDDVRLDMLEHESPADAAGADLVRRACLSDQFDPGRTGAALSRQRRAF